MSSPCLVLLHGYPLDQRIWSAQVEALSPRYRIVTPDLPGFGSAASLGAFTMESLADAVHATLEKSAALPCILGGLSMGGYVALAYAKKYPESLRGLILIDTRHDADAPAAREGRLKLIELARGPDGPAAVSAAMLPRMLSPGTLAQRPQIVKQLRTIMESQPAASLEQAQHAMLARADHTITLAALKVPALIIVGDADVITPPALAAAMAAATPGAQLHTIRGAGHMPSLEQPQQVTIALEQFLKRVGVSV